MFLLSRTEELLLVPLYSIFRFLRSASRRGLLSLPFYGTYTKVPTMLLLTISHLMTFNVDPLMHHDHLPVFRVLKELLKSYSWHKHSPRSTFFSNSEVTSCALHPTFAGQETGFRKENTHRNRFLGTEKLVAPTTRCPITTNFQF